MPQNSPKFPGLQKSLHGIATAFHELPQGARWWLYGAAALLAIVVGAGVTAYAGILLVLLLWALCMGGLLLLLRTTWQLAFPNETISQNRALVRCFAVGALVGVAVIAALVLYRHTVYGEDAINYYAKQTLLFGSFGSNGFYGLSNLAENLMAADYKMFMNLFITLPYLLTNRSINAFMLCYALCCFVPMWFALLMVAKKISALAGQGTPRWDALYYSLCMGAMVLWPMFLWPATHGMPDAFGLVFTAVILLLTVDYRFETLQPARLVCLFAATFALVLTRRWYMFWIVAYYAVYALCLLVWAMRRKKLPMILANLLKFGLPSAVIIILLLLPTFRTALSTDYADIYGSYYGGGFMPNLLAQVKRQGVLWLLLCGAGLVTALRNKHLRVVVPAVVAVSLLAMALFTKTQSLGDHQSLLLAPAYLVLLFCAFAALCGAEKTPAMLGGAGCALLLVVNFGNALRIPTANVQTMLLSDESLDLTRRTDFTQMRAVTDFVLEHCTPEQTVYINIDSDGYSGSTFAYSDTSHPALQSMILWENSVPSTHGFPTGVWTSKYVMVTDKTDEGGLVGGVNTALRTETPVTEHYAYVTEFPLQNDVTLYCYERLDIPDDAEADYYKALFAEYDARWPDIFSARIDEYLAQNQ